MRIFWYSTLCMVFASLAASLPARMEKMNPDILSMVDLLTSVVKGLCANVLHSLLVVWLNKEMATTESNTTQINDTIYEVTFEVSEPGRSYLRTWCGRECVL